MNINDLIPEPQGKETFKFSSEGAIPEESGCYVLTNYDGDILYIGQSVDMQTRFLQHLADPRKTGLTVNGRAFWFFWLEWESAQLNSLERGWLNNYRAVMGVLPIMNSQNPPV